MRKLFILFCLAVMFGIGAGLLIRHVWHINEPGGWTPEHDMDKLLVIVDASRPLRDAMERYERDHGHYPNDVSNLIPTYLQPTHVPDVLDSNWLMADWGGWRYLSGSTNSYELYFQLSWDGGLWYDHSTTGTNQWTWSTSNASADLTQKCQGR